jgi:endo-1,4-beta-mannosidase
MILDLYEELYCTIRSIDPHRIIVSGDSLSCNAAWHNHHEDAWGMDSRDQWLDMVAADTPARFNAVAMHFYPEHDRNYFAGEKIPMEELFSAAVGRARMLNKPVWCGEFGAASSGDAEREMVERMFKIIKETGVELSALWNFVPFGEFQRGVDIKPDNERAWMLFEIQKFNESVE